MAILKVFDWKDKSVLITGGTGTLGQALVNRLLQMPVRRVCVFSRDELKQSVMQQKFQDGRMRFFLGDVRNYDRVRRAVSGNDVVIHAAALKQIPFAETNPWEYIETNINGSCNVNEAAIDEHIDRLMMISSDKAVSPSVLYGATKLVMERVALASSAYVKDQKTKISCVRYGNVLGSRGSVLQMFRDAVQAQKPLSVTDLNATRFWWTVENAVDFVLACTQIMGGEEVFIPRLKSSSLHELILAVAPKDYPLKETGLRQWEKLHEVMISNDETPWSYRFHYGSLEGFLLTQKPNPFASYALSRFCEPYGSLSAERFTVKELSALVESVS